MYCRYTIVLVFLGCILVSAPMYTRGWIQSQDIRQPQIEWSMARKFPFVCFHGETLVQVSLVSSPIHIRQEADFLDLSDRKEISNTMM